MSVERRRYIAIDLEIARVIPDENPDWKSYRPFGISCFAAAALLRSGEIKTHTWYGVPQLTREASQELVRDIIQWVSKGFTLLTWNGLGFDFDVLAEESGLFTECCDLALDHVDMMLQVFCVKGYRLGLDAAAKGLGLPGKTDGMNGAQAPVMWAQGECEKVLEYVTQDVRTTLNVALGIERRRRLEWISKKGKPNSMSIPRWLTVKEALDLPLPDTSWMSDPSPRSGFTEWMRQGQSESRSSKIVNHTTSPQTTPPSPSRGR